MCVRVCVVVVMVMVSDQDEGWGWKGGGEGVKLPNATRRRATSMCSLRQAHISAVHPILFL